MLSIQPQIRKVSWRTELSEIQTIEREISEIRVEMKRNESFRNVFFLEFGEGSRASPLGRQLRKNLFYSPLKFPEILARIFDRMESAQLMVNTIMSLRDFR